MDAKYRYGHKPGRRRRTRVLIVVVISMLVIGAIVSTIVLDLRKSQNKPVNGTAQTVVQSLDDTTNNLTIDEPTFSMELPSDWKEIGRLINQYEHSITWQPTEKDQQNRTLKLYIDMVPTTKSVNKLLPVIVQGNTLAIGDLSDNCATFTQGGTLNAGQAQFLQDKQAKWEKVDFICDLARVTDNEIGTGADGINTITVTGQKSGVHKYFFLYTDRNVQPDYMTFYNAIRSFKAK